MELPGPRLLSETHRAELNPLSRQIKIRDCAIQKSCHAATNHRGRGPTDRDKLRIRLPATLMRDKCHAMIRG